MQFYSATLCTYDMYRRFNVMAMDGRDNLAAGLFILFLQLGDILHDLRT